MYDVVGGIVRHSATLGDAVIRLARFGRLLGAGFDMRLEVHGERGMIEEPHYTGPLLHIQGIFCQLAVIGLTAQRLTGERLRPIEYRVIPQRPPYAAAIEELLETPVRFGATHNALVFPSSHLHKAVRAVDRERLRTLEREAESLLEQTQAAPGFANTVEALLALGLAGEGAEAIATRLDITPRTLARRLRAEGTSFQEIRDDVRRKLAESYLRKTAMPAADIALALGFSDATAFSRAFRRWTGVSPIRYRTETAH
jgi:AraC-like DNA-binding protein